MQPDLVEECVGLADSYTWSQVSPGRKAELSTLTHGKMPEDEIRSTAERYVYTPGEDSLLERRRKIQARGI